ncbi:hypothetical protein GCM10027446_17580 [Angustibacter peucedani]
MTEPRTPWWCAGLDLAWGTRARTGCAVVSSSGALIDSCAVRSDDEIAAFLGPYLGDLLSVGVDAPLVVANATGSRAAERLLGADYRRFGAGAYPSNRGIAHLDPPRGGELARRFGWDVDPLVRPAPGRPTAIEVYPHPATVALFGLPVTLKYKAKRGRSVTYRQEQFELLCSGLETVGPLLLQASARWAELREAVRSATRQVDLERVEDEIDAVLCAHLAWLWVVAPESLRLYGDPVAGYAATGYIVAPPPPSG